MYFTIWAQIPMKIIKNEEISIKIDFNLAIDTSTKILSQSS